MICVPFAVCSTWAAGPGTNTALFANVDYTGMDINPAYIRQAQRRFRRNFVVADVTRYRVSSAERYDFIFVNSLLHHLPDDAVHDLLQHLSTLLTTDGRIHILELVLPEQPFLARKMAQWDRGKYARPLAQWELLFRSAFQTTLFEPYPVRVAGLEALSMVYFKGCPAVSSGDRFARCRIGLRAPSMPQFVPLQSSDLFSCRASSKLTKPFSPYTNCVRSAIARTIGLLTIAAR